jgi:outer membrane protein assembly factor BamB
MLGRVHAARKDFRRAVGEFQRLLEERGGEVVSAVRVFDLARDAIEGALRAGGREAYAEHEARARELLEAARRQGSPEGLSQVFRAYPNSTCAEEALFESAGAHARLGRVEDQVAALREFLREYPAAARAAEAHAGLVRVLESRGHTRSARRHLRHLERSFPDAEVTDQDGKVKAREFAARRLASEAYAASVEAAPPAELKPPLKKILERTERQHPEGAPLRTAGVPPPGLADLLLMDYGPVIQALDLRRGVEAWKVGVPSGVREAVFVDGALILADEKSVQRVHPATGGVEWQHVSRAPMSGFGLAEAYLCFFTADADGTSVLSALDLGSGAVAWSRSVEGLHPSGVRAAGEAVVFTTVSPGRLHRCEVDTGRELPLDAASQHLRPAEIVRAEEGRVVLMAEGPFLEAYDLPAGTLRWRVRLRGVAPRAVEAGPGAIVILGSVASAGRERDEAFLAAVDPDTGKFLAVKQGGGYGDPRFLEVEGSCAYVVSEEPDGSVGVRSLRLPDLSLAWAVQAGGKEATALPPAVARGHVVVPLFEGNPEGRYAYVGVLLDKTGTVVENIRSGFRFERPPLGVVSGDRVVFSADNQVDVYR